MFMCLVRGMDVPNVDAGNATNSNGGSQLQVRRKQKRLQWFLAALRRKVLRQPKSPAGASPALPEVPTAIADKDAESLHPVAIPEKQAVGGISTPVIHSDRLEAADLLSATPGSCKARQKKFHRHFAQVPPDERVLNYYSCALVADILLQGHLYITRNYFAFYSNVFGYVTKVLIPTANVLKVTKEKTAYIIPNAVGIATDCERHVFGSLLSRDSTYQLMMQVWAAAVLPPLPQLVQVTKASDGQICLPDDESSLSGSETTQDISKCADSSPDLGRSEQARATKKYQDSCCQTSPVQSYQHMFLRSLPSHILLQVFSTVLLVLLFTSAAVLLYRIDRIQSHISARSIDDEVQDFIDTNLDQISKVRRSLETLAMLIAEKETDVLKDRWSGVRGAHQLPPPMQDGVS